MTTIEEVPEVTEVSLPPPPPGEPLAPVSASERVDTIDILRGMALFGILAANIRGFAGPAMTYFEPHRFWGLFHDRLAQAFIDTFVQGKFITLFAFLFGVGFAVQLERSETRVGKFGWTFSRRLFILLLFGLVHGLLIWWGDILLTYALTGFLLLFFRKRRDKTLLIWAIVGFMIPVLLAAMLFVVSQLGYGPPSPPEPTAADIQEQAKTFADGSWMEIEQQRAVDAVAMNWGFFPVFFPHILALFLAGLLAWRKRLFHPSPESLPRYRRAMWIALAIGIPGNGAITIVRWMKDVSPAPTTPLSAIVTIGASFVVIALSTGYLCAVILLCNNERWKAKLQRFGAVGRTALSNYLLQSIVGTLIFYSYGLGLFGRVGPALLLPLTVLIYAMQVALSQWWLARYRYGPAEWLWRRVTYRRPLPNHVSPNPSSALRAPSPRMRGDGF